MNINNVIRFHRNWLLMIVLMTSVVSAAEKPNIILIIIDDLGWADLGCYGADLHKTPHIDRFCMNAVRFTDAYAAAPVCTPTRASIMTGKYPARLHMTVWSEMALKGPVKRQGLITPPSIPNLPHQEVTLAETLREAGYFTAHIGKWHLGNASHYPETHGFDLNIGASLWGAPPTFFYPYRGLFGRNRDYRYVPRLEWGDKGEYLTDRLTNEAITTIRRVKNKPFFLHLAYHTVHTPIEAKPEFVKHFRRDLRDGMLHQNPTYAAMVASMDENFGRLLLALDEQHLAESTAIILVSDNGGFINDYNGRSVTSNSPLRSGKGSLYEGGLRIPLIMRIPGRSKGEVTCSTPVITNDLYATCCELAAVTNKMNHDGVSLLPLLDDSTAKLNRDALFFHYPHFYSTTTPVSALRVGDMKLLHYYIDNHDELYDLSSDLSEQQNLVESKSVVAMRLRKKLDDWLNSISARRPKGTSTRKSR